VVHFGKLFVVDSLSRTESNKITWRMLLDAEWKR